MDPYYHSHHQWRPFPPPPSAAPAICPTCSHSHFPFCPPLPPPLPPPPPYNQNPINKFPDYPQYDPYHHPPPPAPYSYHHHQPDFHPNPRPAASNGYITDAGRTHKRPRVDENLPVMMFSSDNERRLKLIRDHGSAADCQHWGPAGPGDNTNCSGNNNMYSPFQSNSNNDPNGSPGFRGYCPPPTLPPPPRSYENGAFLGQPPPPPLPASPPPPPPPPLHSPPKASFSLFPVPVSSSGSNPYLHSNPGSGASVSEEWGGSTRQYRGEAQAFVHKQLSPDKPAIVDASRLFKQPYRTMRPNRLVIILRGLPGSGKSYLAKMIRDLEVENGSEAPRIHSMDDYFMTEVEKVEDCDTSKSASTARGKKQTVKKVMEYCYEPEMEEAYRESMLKAFKKTLEEGIFTLVIVDDRNLRVADFAQFWAIAKRSGYEVYVSEAVYKDPVGCAARNVHGFTLDEIQRMANQWEEAPSLYMQLDNKSLFHGDDLKESGIQEVDMDTEDGDVNDDSPGLHEKRSERALITSLEDEEPHDSSEDGNRWGAEEDHPHGVKELGKSKWSNNLDEDDAESSKAVKGNLNALSGLVQAYGKRRKSVHWSDQAAYSGFSISTVLKRRMPSLVIGPGAGYNLKSNPLHAEESSMGKSVGRSRNQTVFQERLRAEHESFKAVFDKRRQRIGGLALEEE